MNSGTLPRLQVVVLAAGFSSRLGQPKALARVHGQSLLRRTLTLVARFAPARIIVVLPSITARYRHESRGLGALLTANVQRGDGLSSSVHRGIAQGRYSAALLLLPVDLAILNHRDMARLIARWRRTPRRVAARAIGQHAGIPLILPRWLYSRSRRIAGDAGLRDMVKSLPAEQRVLLDLASAAFDVDTPQDLEHARHRLRSTSFRP